MTHLNVVAGLDACDERVKLSSADSILAAAVFYHAIGFYITLVVAMRRGTNVVVVAAPSFDGMLDLIDEHKISMVFDNPPMIPAIAGAGANGRLQSLEKVYSGGDSLDLRTETALRDAFPEATAGQGYGLTEFMPLTIIGIDDGHPVGTVGRAVDGVTMKIVDIDDGHECELGERGEVVAKGSQSFRGYRGNPEATAALFDSEGWFRTADLGYVDEDGFLFLNGRLKEMITVGGKRFAPKEFQDLVLQLELVREVVAAGHGDDPSNQSAIVFVVGDESLTAEDVKAVLGKQPELPDCEVVFVEAIPKSPAGKILRTELLRDLSRSPTCK